MLESSLNEKAEADSQFLSLYLWMFSLDVIAQCCDAPVLMETHICQLGSGWISHASHFMNSVSPSNYENPSESACISLPAEESQWRSSGLVCGCRSMTRSPRNPNSSWSWSLPSPSLCLFPWQREVSSHGAGGRISVWHDYASCGIIRLPVWGTGIPLAHPGIMKAKPSIQPSIFP